MPIPLQKAFTYAINKAESEFLAPGMRIAVPFGKSKVYTGIVYATHRKAPTAYEAKEIFQILDDRPLLTKIQISHWEWIAEYYMCSLGEVMRAALPNAFLLESESVISRKEGFDELEDLSEAEEMVWEALGYREKIKVQELGEFIEPKKVLPVVQGLLGKQAVEVKEEIYQKYRPKMVKYVQLSENFKGEDQLHELLDNLSRAEKQRKALLVYFKMGAGKNRPLALKQLQADAEVSDAAVRALVKKGVLEISEVQEDRVSFVTERDSLKELNQVQETALFQIRSSFDKQEVCLLHGITSSGKTEIYMHLINEVLEQGKQVLYLLPEIALTTHIISRLQEYFGDRISVFHSRYSVDERVEVWNNLLDRKPKTDIILGARSSLLLPYSNLGLIIVDEEHDPSFKQFDPAPRYHARDAAIMLGQLHEAKVLLGSATPSVESYYNCQSGKYGLVNLDRRFGDLLLPEMELVDIKDKYRRKRMKGHFSDRLLELIQEALKEKTQVILFQNRRGYSPIVECLSCGTSPQCPNCDVSLTYHKFRGELRCHYCGHHSHMPELCLACGNPTLDTKGFGTEQIELELGELFPDHRIARMDLDTTRGKYGYQKLLHDFQDGEIDILVGTQMLTKGLDFKNVSLVGVLNADNLLNFPDFRAQERTFQLMVQVAGRAGRFGKRGKVAIQTFNPYHVILQQVSVNDYQGMVKEQLFERSQFLYPPYVRLVKIQLKHRDHQKVALASEWLGRSLRNSFGDHVLGPTTPPVGRIRSKYLRNLLIKLPKNVSLKASKAQIAKIRNSFEAIPDFRSVQVVIDVDNQ